MVEEFADNCAEDGVAQEFEPFVRLDASSGDRSVRQSQLKQLPVAKLILKGLFALGDFVFDRWVVSRVRIPVPSLT